MILDVVHSQERAVLDGLNQFDGALTDQNGNGMVHRAWLIKSRFII